MSSGPRLVQDGHQPLLLQQNATIHDAAQVLQVTSTKPNRRSPQVRKRSTSSFTRDGIELETSGHCRSTRDVGSVGSIRQPDRAADVIDKAEVTTKRTARSRLSLSLGVEDAGDGGSVGMKAMRRRQLSKQIEEGTGEMALRLLKSLGGEQGPSAPTPVNTVRQAPDLGNHDQSHWCKRHRLKRQRTH
ncbi:MAG: hypothetical protein Q8L48_29275 [Archangium sp.]|nr:hypothetical protein [Archangium sp.]